jgi:hypothetical protein
VIVGQSRVSPADGARVQGNMLDCAASLVGIPSENQLSRAAGDAHKADLAMLGIAANHLETTRKKLNRLFGWSVKANSFRPRRFVDRKSRRTRHIVADDSERPLVFDWR